MSFKAEPYQGFPLILRCLLMWSEKLTKISECKFSFKSTEVKAYSGLVNSSVLCASNDKYKFLRCFINLQFFICM